MLCLIHVAANCSLSNGFFGGKMDAAILIDQDLSEFSSEFSSGSIKLCT